MQTSAIAEYDEVRFSGRRKFRLYDDKIEVVGKETLASTSEMTFDLSILSADFDKLHVRSKQAYHGASMFGGGLVVGWTLHSYYRLTFESPLMGVSCAFVVVGLLLFITFFPKVSWVNFKNREGVTVLSIACTRNKEREFEHFVDAVSNQITMLQNKKIS